MSDDCFHIGDAETPEEVLQNHLRKETTMPEEDKTNPVPTAEEQQADTTREAEQESVPGPAGYAMSTGARFEMRRSVKAMFTYHQPDAGGNQTRRYRLIREMAMELAETIYLNTPRCADQSAAIRKLRECVFTANAAIALDGAV